VFKFAQDPRGYCVASALPANFPINMWEAPERWQLLDVGEIQKVLALAPEEVRPCLVFIANTGVRVGTALATEPAWVDLRRGVVQYPAIAMKGRYAHTVELNEAATAVLRAALEQAAEKPFPYSYWYLLKRWLALREAAGHPTLRLHALRHSYVSNQLAAGTPIHVVRDMAAHRSLSVTALYAHSTDEARKAAAKRVQISTEPVRRDTSRDTNPNSRIRKRAKVQVPRDGIEPPTRGFSSPGQKRTEPRELKWLRLLR
jgi:integrase